MDLSEYKAIEDEIMPDKKTTLERLSAIQQELKAPKGQYNDFSNYNYRSCEDILEAVKPLLAKHELMLTLSDEMVQVGDRYYVKAETSIYAKDLEPYAVTAYAREEETKKGMDASQITGSASSYARKYALNGMFLIDDTRDADTQDNRDQGTHSGTLQQIVREYSQPQPTLDQLQIAKLQAQSSHPQASPNKPASDKQKGLVMFLLTKAGVNRSNRDSVLSLQYGVTDFENLSSAQISDLITAIKEQPPEVDANDI